MRVGHGEEFKQDNIGVNGLWPRTAIATAAVKNILGGEELMSISEPPEIWQMLHYEIFNKDPATYTGNFCIDDLVLYEEGIRDFTKYADVPYAELALDFFLPDDTPLPMEIKNS